MWLDIVTLIGVGALLLLLRYYLPGYMTQKGKNLATKEDVDGLTRQIESVKHEYAASLESMRASLTSRVHIHSVRYENEYRILSELSKLIVDLRDAATNLRPTTEYRDPDESEEDRRHKKLDTFFKAANAFYLTSEAKRPFYPEQVYELVDQLRRVAWSEAMQYARLGDKHHLVKTYWEDAEKNVAEIKRLSNKLMKEIRERVKHWERIDEGDSE